MRLIDADALKEAIETYDKFACLTDTRLVTFRRISGHEEDYEPYVKLRDIRNAIDNAPTVEQNWKFYFDHGYAQAKRDLKRPQGEWIRKVDEAGFISHICSECGAEIEVEDCSDDKFCFNCGAKMKRGAE